jgi:hypothetical protein
MMRATRSRTKKYNNQVTAIYRIYLRYLSADTVVSLVIIVGHLFYCLDRLW